MSRRTRARLEVLRNRDFRLFLVARLLATLAVQMQTVAVGSGSSGCRSSCRSSS
jgi:hypothetical protein